MNKEDINAIQWALRFFNNKIRYEICTPACCNTKEACTELIRLIELLEKENAK